MVLADLHIHSRFSDGRLTIPQIVDLYGQRGFGAIAITDHLCESQTVLGKASSYLGLTLTEATFPLYMAILESERIRAWEQYGMLVIPGIELSKNSVSNHRSAHILGLGIRDYIAADREIVDLCRQIRAQGAVTIAAHPVWTRVREKQTYHLWYKREELAQEIDAWEVASGRMIFDEVASSPLPKLATSDLHRAAQIESWKTVLHCEKHREAILDAIRKQNLSFIYYEEKYRHGDRSLDRTSPVGLRLSDDVARHPPLAEAV